MILILGGTTEGRLAVNTLDESGSPFYYSTRGDEQEVSLHHGIRLQGGMDAGAMEQFCRQKGIRLLVDAAHPFAEELHRNVATVGQRLQVPVIRLERIYPPRTTCPVIWCADYDEAVKKYSNRIRPLSSCLRAYGALPAWLRYGKMKTYAATAASSTATAHACWPTAKDFLANASAITTKAKTNES